MADRDFLIRLTKELIEQGKLIEAGWIGLRLAAVPKDAPPIQLETMREAFFAGAHHMLASMMSTLDPEAEPTEADLRRMDLIHAELEAFIEKYKRDKGLAEFDLRRRPSEGSA